MMPSKFCTLWFMLVVFLISISSAIPQVSASESEEKPIVTKDVYYTSDKEQKQQSLDLYLPANKVKDAPVHVFVHGGGWTKGDKKHVSPSEAKSYTSKGIIFVSLNYRLGPEHKFPSNVNDIISASNWLNKNISEHGGNPKNMVLSGHSAGAHLVALAGVSSEDLIYKAIIPVDTASFDLTKPSQGKLSRWIDRQKKAVFGADEQVLKRASPVYQVKKGAEYPSFHLFVTARRPNAVAETRRFKNALSNGGHNVTMDVLDSSLNHGDMKKELFSSDSPIFKTILETLKPIR